MAERRNSRKNVKFQVLVHKSCQKICQTNGKQLKYIGKTTLLCFCNVLNESIMESLENPILSLAVKRSSVRFRYAPLRGSKGCRFKNL